MVVGDEEKNEEHSGQTTHVFGELQPYTTTDQFLVPHMLYGLKFLYAAWKSHGFVSTGENIDVKGLGVVTFLCILVRVSVCALSHSLVCLHRYVPSNRTLKHSGRHTGRATVVSSTTLWLAIPMDASSLVLKSFPLSRQHRRKFPDRYKSV